MNDAIKLTVPHQKNYHGVIRLVVGGLAARLDLSYESLEDLQLALESLLGNEAYASSEDVTVELELTPGTIKMLVGPLDGARLRSDLEAKAGDGEGVTLGRLLATVVGDVHLEERDGGQWVRLEKAPPGTAASA